MKGEFGCIDHEGQELMEELIRQGYYVTDEWSDLRFY